MKDQMSFKDAKKYFQNYIDCEMRDPNGLDETAKAMLAYVKALSRLEQPQVANEEALEWLDGKHLKMDDNLMFSKGYCYDGMECLGQSARTNVGMVFIWPDRISDGEWNYYFEVNGGYQSGFKDELSVKDRVNQIHRQYLTNAQPKTVDVGDMGSGKFKLIGEYFHEYIWGVGWVNTGYRKQNQ